MCFCASASFIAAGGLVLTGSFASHLAQRRADAWLAAIPFLFAIQQIAEGFAWITLPPVQSFFAYMFLMFAFGVWPVWMPLTALAYEHEPIRRVILCILSIIGALISCFSLTALALYGAQVTSQGSHLAYWIPMPRSSTVTLLVLPPYVLATVFPGLLSSNNALRFVGMLSAASVIISFAFDQAFFISVWCFFAALVSLSVLIVLMSSRSSQS